MKTIKKSLTKIFSAVLLAILGIIGQPALADSALTPADFPQSVSGLSNLLKVVFTPRYFEPHWEHFIFDPILMWSLVSANVVTFIAYTLIPIALIYFVMKRKDVFGSKLFWLFGAFIILCGLHHLVHVITFWYPIYHVQNIVDVSMAIVSIGTFFALLPVLPEAIKLKSPKELEIINTQLSTEVKERSKAQEELKKSAEKLSRRKEELEEALTLAEDSKAELQALNKIMTGRELKMAELKQRISELES